jgi:hypothetical protein
VKDEKNCQRLAATVGLVGNEIKRATIEIEQYPLFGAPK